MTSIPAITDSRKQKFTQIVKRRRRDGEVPSFRVAVRNFCLECVSYSSQEVDNCVDQECWLYPLRHGRYPRGYRARHQGNPSFFKPVATGTNAARNDADAECDPLGAEDETAPVCAAGGAE